MKHTLEFDGIRFSINERVILSDVFMRCETNVITVLLGRNGQGKTCLFNIVYGTLSAEDRGVRVDGRPVSSPFKRPDLLKFLPQFNYVPGFLTLQRVFKDTGLDMVEFVNRFPEFAPRVHQKIRHLSGGERRLVEIYIILCSKAQFVILDEPFTHLMPLQIERVKQLMVEEKTNKGILVTDHMYTSLLDIADHTYVLAGGKTHLLKDHSELGKLGYIPV